MRLLRDDRRFEPRLGWTLLALAGIVLFCSLGRWQLHRAEEKRVLHAGFAAGAGEVLDLPSGLQAVPRYQRVRVAGRYDAGRQFLLDNMPKDGVPGVHVLTPLLRSDGSIVVVDRGFIPSPGRRDTMPSLPLGEAPRTLTGRADAFPRPAVRLEGGHGTGWPRWVSFPRAEDLAADLDAPVYPQLLLLDGDQPDGFTRDWQPPGMPASRHVGYAVQWFGLAAAVAVTWLVLSFRKRTDIR